MAGKYFNTQSSATYLLTAGSNPLTIGAQGTIVVGGSYGVYGAAIGTTWTVANQGLISGGAGGITLAGAGIVTNAGTILSADTGSLAAGVILGGGGSLYNAGLIQSGHDGARLLAAGTVTNGSTSDIAARITGASAGVVVGVAGGVVANDAVIAGGTYGVLLGVSGSVTNGSAADTAASISGPVDGVLIAAAVDATITNYGTIRAASTAALSGQGVVLINPSSATPGTIANLGTAALIYGITHGVFLSAGGMVLNQGTIAAGSAAGIGVVFGTGATATGSLVNAGAAALISGGVIGVLGSSVATVTNDGTITAYGTAVLLAAGGAVTNAAGATIQAASAFAVKIVGTGSVFNSGTIQNNSVGYTAIYLDGSGAVTNTGSGLIQSAAHAIGVSGLGTITNQGTILSTSQSYSAINLVAGGTITNAAGATLSGLQDAVYAYKGAVTLTNAGTVTASRTAVDLLDGGVVTNTAGAEIQAVAGYGVQIVGSASIYNDGLISAASTSASAIYLHGATSGVVTNAGSGLISGARHGIDVYGNEIGTITNQGTIRSTSQAYSAIDLAAGGTITNQTGGLIQGAYHALYLGAAGVITNAAGATLSGAQGGVFTGNGAVTLTNAGTIAAASASGQAVTLGAGYANRLIADPGAAFTGTVSGGNTVGAAAVSTLELAAGASVGTLSGLGTQFVDFSTVTVDAGATWTLAGANTLDAGVVLSGAGTLINAGTLIGGTGAAAKTLAPGLLLNDGTIAAGAGDPLTITATLTAGAGQTGSLLVIDSGTLALTGAVAADQSATFTGTTAAGLLQLGPGVAFAGTIAGFLPGDTIDLLGITASNVTLLAGNTLAVTETGGGTIDLALNPAQSFGGDIFHFAALAGGAGTAITDSTPCYLAGTAILTDRGERKVETLKIGDRVVTRSGQPRPIKWIGTRSFAAAAAAGNRDVIPIRIRPGALADDVPRRDLFVSPLHALYLDHVLVAADLLVNEATILRCPEIDPIRYFHIELETHDILLAEGAPAESFIDCDSRAMFHNAADFAARYPAAATARWAFCAPRVESGPALATIRQTIARRAGLRADGVAGALAGFLDTATKLRIAGWARDAAHPATPVELEVSDNGGVIAHVTANQFRQDLLAAGIGDGRHGFELRLTAGLAPDRRHEIRVRRAADGAELPGSPIVVEATVAPDAAMLTRRAIEAAVDGAGSGAEADALLGTLRAAMLRLRARRAAPETGPNETGLLAWADPRRRRHALVIDGRLPRPDQDAGSNAVLGHIDALRTLGWTVEAIGADELAAPADAIATLAAHGAAALGLPEVTSVEDALRTRPEGFDLIYLHRLANAESYAWLARRYQPRARLIYSVADLHHLRLERQARLTGDLGLMAESRVVKAREFAAMRAADVVLTHSPAEAALLAGEAPGARVHVVGWAETPRPVAVPFSARNGIAFIGGQSHGPNADAVRWLAEEIMPLVWARAPDLHCYIVGEGWDRAIEGADPRIRLLGPLRRLDGLFDMVRLTVAPLRFGAGIKGKVLSSLAAGIPCAMTPLAAEGLPLGPPLRPLVAADAAGLAALLVRLHGDAAAQEALRVAGLAMVRRYFTPAGVAKALAAALAPTQPRQAGARKKGAPPAIPVDLHPR